jgi:hypothetical protein
MAREKKARKEDAPIKGNGGHEDHVWTDEERRMVQETAYFRAEQRGFQGGTPEEDWYAAEKEILKQEGDREYGQ